MNENSLCSYIILLTLSKHLLGFNAFCPASLSGEENYLPCFTFDYSNNFTGLQDTSLTESCESEIHHLKFHTNYNR